MLKFGLMVNKKLHRSFCGSAARKCICAKANDPLNGVVTKIREKMKKKYTSFTMGGLNLFGDHGINLVHWMDIQLSNSSLQISLTVLFTIYSLFSSTYFIHIYKKYLITNQQKVIFISGLINYKNVFYQLLI